MKGRVSADGRRWTQMKGKGLGTGRPTDYFVQKGRVELA